MNAAQTYEAIGQAIGCYSRTIVCKPCFKIKGKAFICFYRDNAPAALDDAGGQ